MVRRGMTFNENHLKDYGLQKVCKNPVNVQCKFCFHFGREEKVGAKRKQTANFKKFEAGAFQTFME
jgi:hypothetical protein